MTIFRNLWADLVDKRLWPVALVLLLALVALPVLLLRGGGGDDHVDVAATPTAGAAGGQAVVAVDGTTKRVALHGSRRDPFAPSGSSDTTTTASSSSSSSSASGSTSTSGSSSGGTSTTGGSSDSGSSDSGSDSTGSDSSGSGSSGTTSTDIVVRFGKAGEGGKLRVVAPLEALPSRGNPLVIYLGAKDGQAVFLVSSDVTPSGDMTCKPSKDVCQKAYVDAGHRVKLTVGDADGGTEYVIQVVRAGS